MSLLQVRAAQLLPERRALLVCRRVVELAVLQPRLLEFRHREQLDQLRAHFRQAERRGQVRNADSSCFAMSKAPVVEIQPLAAA